ncbi:MAG: nitronate monooxygenase [Rhodospirillaceae bacterium]|nr:nitronate monooxygenase [Rhodospirillaceae bacterium]
MRSADLLDPERFRPSWPRLTYRLRLPRAHRGEARSKAGCAFLGSEYAIMGGAMSWVSNHTLVAAICNAGGFGVLASGALSPAELDFEIAATRAGTDRPFGVNLITFDQNLAGQLEVCLDRRVSHIVLGGGLPSAELIAAAKRAGARILCFAASLQMGQRAIRNGAEALIVEGHEAGGHVGPVSTNVLVQEMMPLMGEVPVFVAGGIGRGEMIAHFIALGAAGCQLGTRFVCARESRVHPRVKAAYIRASARDATLSPQLDPRFRIIPVRAIANKATAAFIEKQREAIVRYQRKEISLAEAQAEIETFWAGRLRRAVFDGDAEYGSLMAGQSVGFVTREESVREIIEQLVDEAETAYTPPLLPGLNLPWRTAASA